ncbi:MAG: hypothetical protein NVS1B4_08650 [Gemmatimonadaceae bacterium]
MVALEALVDSVTDALEDGTLYDYAKAHPRAVPLAGRGVAYAVPLPDGRTRVVVRHSRHGGVLARVTGDRFLAPTRAPYELSVAVRLAAVGVPTPEIVAYLTYPGGWGTRRSDIATREIPRSRDLAVALLARPDAAARESMLAATSRLLSALADAGARHCDLNLKNILVTGGDGRSNEAYVLDVDRVEFVARGRNAVASANFDRLARSARTWRLLYGLELTEVELDDLRAACHGT